MQLSRRSLLRLGLGALTLPLSRAADAAPFVNTSGLQRGQFVWQPALAADGPVMLVVTARQQMLHVYRGGVEIGFAPVRVPSAEARPALAVFNVGDVRRDRRSRSAAARDQRLVWSGSVVHSDRIGQSSARQPAVMVSDEFAHLAFEVCQRGATLVMADERALVERITRKGLPVVAGLSEAAASEHAIRLLQRAARTAETSDPLGREASIVVSRRDGRAALVREGRIVRSAPLQAAALPASGGAHVFMLVGAAAGDTAAATWQTLAVGRSVQARHIVEPQADSILASLAVADQAEGLAMLSELGRGAVIYVTDASLSGAAPGVQELLSNREPPSAAAVSEAAPRPTQRLAGRWTGKSAGKAQRPTRTVELPEAPSASRLANELFQSDR